MNLLRATVMTTSTQNRGQIRKIQKMLMKDILEKEETQPHSMKAPELSANCAEAQKIKKRIAEL